jgi:hypothetical protein
MTCEMTVDWVRTVIVGFLNTQNSLTTMNYSAIANSHILHFSTARTYLSLSDEYSPVVAL